MSINILEKEDALVTTCLEKFQVGTKPPIKLAVEVKKRIATRNQALHIVLQLRDLTGHDSGTLVFTDWIPEPAAAEFRKAGIFFVDAQGNAFIRRPPQILVDIRGKKPERALKAEPGRLIEPAGLKVVHYLLTHPEVVGEPLRAIGEGAGVALGTVHIVMKELQRGQWILLAKGAGPRSSTSFHTGQRLLRTTSCCEYSWARRINGRAENMP